MPRQTGTTVISWSPRHGLEGIQSQDVPERWLDVRQWLLPAIERSGGRLSERTVFDGARATRYQLWVIHAGDPVGAMVTRVAVYDTGLRALEIVLIGGRDIETWGAAMTEIDDLARAKECALIEGQGRLGWEGRVPDGWKRTFACFEKDLRE